MRQDHDDAGLVLIQADITHANRSCHLVDVHRSGASHVAVAQRLSDPGILLLPGAKAINR